MAEWTVKTPEGSLDFPSFAEVERAYRIGLISPEDELREKGRGEWRKASSHPVLRGAKARQGGGQRPLLMPIALAVVLAGAALALLVAGYWIPGVLLAFVLTGFLFRVNRRAFTPRHTFARDRSG